MRRAITGASVLGPIALMAVLLGACGAAAGPAHPREPLAQVLGIAPGTTEARAHRVLAGLGQRLKDADGTEEEAGAGLGRELWRLHDPRFAWVQLAVDERHRVRAIQAHVRPDGPGLRYAEIGDLTKARRLGYTILEWSVPGSAAHPGRRVTARGADSVFAATVTIAAAD